MKIYSEKTNKEYKSVEECLKAEKAFDTAEAEKAEKAREAANTRKMRAKEVETAFNEVREAENAYLALRRQFIKDYGSYHQSYYMDSDGDFESFFNSLIDLM